MKTAALARATAHGTSGAIPTTKAFGGKLTDDEIKVLVAYVRTLKRTPQDEAPEWLKVSDAVRRFSIGRTSLYALIRNGSIKTVLIRKRGNTLGCRLISTDSLRSYIEGFVENHEGHETQPSLPARKRQN